jgi:hypothetical protein
MPGTPATRVAWAAHHAAGQRHDETQQQQRYDKALHVFSSESVTM